MPFHQAPPDNDTAQNTLKTRANRRPPRIFKCRSFLDSKISYTCWLPSHNAGSFASAQHVGYNGKSAFLQHLLNSEAIRVVADTSKDVTTASFLIVCGSVFEGNYTR